MRNLITDSFEEMRAKAMHDTEAVVNLERGNGGNGVCLSDAQFLEGVFWVKGQMENLSERLLGLQQLNDIKVHTANHERLRQLREQSAVEISALHKDAIIVKARLDTLREANRGEFEEHSDRNRMLITSGLRLKLKDLMKTFNRLRETSDFELRDYLTRHYFYEHGVYPSVEHIESIMSSDVGPSAGGAETVSVMEMLKSLEHLHQLFVAMNILVEALGEKTDSNTIEHYMPSGESSSGTEVNSKNNKGCKCKCIIL